MAANLLLTDDGESAVEMSFDQFIALNVDAMALDATEADAFAAEIRGAIDRDGAYRGGGGACGTFLLSTPEALARHLDWLAPCHATRSEP